MTLRRKVIGDLRAQGGAFFAVWLTIVLGLTFYGSTYPAGVAMIDSSLATYDLLHFADFTAHFEAAPADIVDTVVAIDGVERVDGRWVVSSGLELQAPDRLNLRLISLPEDNHPEVNDILVPRGDEIDASGQMFLLESFANYHDIQPGDSLRVWVNDTLYELVVAGLVFAPEYLIAGESPLDPVPQPSKFGVGYIRYDELSTMLGQENQINDIVLTIADAVDEEAIRAALESTLKPYNLDHVQHRLQMTSAGVVDANINGNFPINTFFSSMFLLISSLVMAVILARMMDAETRRIGTMRALGLSRAETLRHYMAFPLIIGLSGAVVGSALGYLLSFGTAQYFIETLFGGSLPTFVNKPQWGFILFGAGLTFVLALLSGVYPIWRASKTDPGLALRPATPKGMSAQARLSIPGLPLSARQAVRNMLRVPTRTFSTLVGVLIGFVTIIVASGMADTSLHILEVQFEEGLNFDLRVVWESPAAAAIYQERIDALSGISSSEMVLARADQCQSRRACLRYLRSRCGS